MRDKLSESAIVRALARQSAQRITRKVIAALQRMKETLSGEDSELATTWDEICVQVQSEESIYWDTYDLTVRSLVDAYVDELPPHERDAIWLQTDEGIDWDCELPEEREVDPVFNDHVVDYLIRDYVYAEAGRWENVRIRAYLERSSARD